ncbi:MULTISPECIES: LTA synthase family protein [unclassified Fibrobacter]|uniref:LTA synthase family protein n=1 Tax=unclassified Fibrobacter TaxID=2634177 RepID=UPI0025BBF5DD|nr:MULTISPECIES: LTA synthase family protein [unclassified Fibrobacter]
MDTYTINFFVTSAISAILAVFLVRSRRLRLVAVPVVPVLHYCLFYNFDSGLIGGIFPLLPPYVGALYTAFLFRYFSSFGKIKDGISAPEKKHALIQGIFACLGLFLCAVYSKTIPWAIDTFPLSNVEAVLFTVFAGANEGAEEFVISSFIDKALIPGLTLFFIIEVILIAISIFLAKKNGGFKDFLWGWQKIAAGAFVLYCAVISLVLPGIVASAPFKALFQRPVDSELYREHYAHPDSINVTATRQPKNLLVIFLESMETNFRQYTPEIDSLFGQSGFAPGGVNVAGTSWTIAGITGKLCGIPLNMPMGINEYVGKLPTYLPHAHCLMNVLAKQGYNQVYAQGSSGDFTQKRDFWRVHGNVTIHDIEHYKGAGKIPDDYKVFWGFEDRKLYGFVREELDSLALLGNPFAFYMLTVDTHQPGFVDDSCQAQFAGTQGVLPKSLRCASFQLARFLDWAEQRPWFSNTVIAVMGDHAMPSLSSKVKIPPDDTLYWTNFMLNPAHPVPQKQRRYSSFDIFPTLLEAMGFTVEGRSMGLGRSLFSDTPTLLETYGQQVLDSLLRERSIQYDYFLMGK